MYNPFTVAAHPYSSIQYETQKVDLLLLACLLVCLDRISLGAMLFSE